MFDLDAYFRRIAYAGERAPTLTVLSALQALHPRAIPFENLDALAGRAIPLDADSLQRKLVAGGRGGYCFEQNLLFAHVLRALGFSVTALAARVLWERPTDAVGPRTHMLLAVDLAEGRYLSDVGFGGLTPTAPLKVALDVVQRTPHEPFRVVAVERELAVDAEVRGVWKRLYRFDLQPQEQVDIELLNFYVARHPDSPMRSRIMAARVAPECRYALLNAQLTVHRSNGARERRELADAATLRRALTDTFGIDVPPGDDVDRALERALG